MPKPSSSAVRMITATLRCRHMPTSWSIIEKDSALGHDLLAVLDAGAERYSRAFFQLRVHRAPLEGPGGGGDKHRGPVVVHQQRRGRDNDAAGLLTEQRH